MLLGVDLFQPETYQNQPHKTDSTDTKSISRTLIRTKYFERHSRERKSLDYKFTVRTSAEDFSNAFTSLATVFNFVDFVGSLGKVSSENAIFVNLIRRVRRDVAEASRLLSIPRVKDHYNSFADREAWINSVLFDVQRALNDIGAYVDDVRVSEHDGGTVKMRHKFEWVLSHHQKLLSRELALTTYHQSLMAAISTMQAIEMGHNPEGDAQEIYEAPTKPWLRFDDEKILRSPYSRQKWRASHRNFSIPNIVISEHDSQKLEVQPLNSVPTELPGSTPEDLADPDNWDLYAPPQPSRIFQDHMPISRGSLDRARPPSTLIERTTEHHEDPGPLPKSATMPILARRYRPKAVHMRNPAVKHHSLPAELPCLPRQPSLITELSDWVLSGTEDNRAQASSPFKERDSQSSNRSSYPALPNSPTSCPDVVQTISFTPPALSDAQPPENLNEVATSSDQTSTPFIEVPPMLPPRPCQPSQSVGNEVPPPITPEPNPAESRLDVDMSGQTLVLPSQPQSNTLNTENKTDNPSSNSSHTTVSITLESPSNYSTTLKRYQKKSLSRVRIASSETFPPSEVASVPRKLPAVDEISIDLNNTDTAGPIEPSKPPDLPLRPTPPASSPAKAESLLETPAPSASQAKRRRAQARRMKLVYGADE
ncbi:hypothetical protein CC78DRAFT_612501 [Lojkania enalia]|uniref:Uncharacterized protein n=1 Tax=Lojkania enalia TaxID=147567 RepID=A0A9P4NAD0_9PLEO|nr:hypothetical protein CC78DRAFT_612501 [Didymosphaeria enalia]